jgi:hypothetical protein
MKTIEINLREDFDNAKVEQAKQVFNALVTTGALIGVKGGKAIIHFDADGTFQGIELDYWPWRKRKV